MLQLNVKDTPAQALHTQGLALLSAADLPAALHLPEGWAQAFATLHSAWDRLPPDAHLRDGGHYRRRRHSCYVQDLAQDTRRVLEKNFPATQARAGQSRPSTGPWWKIF